MKVNRAIVFANQGGVTLQSHMIGIANMTNPESIVVLRGSVLLSLIQQLMKSSNPIKIFSYCSEMFSFMRKAYWELRHDEKTMRLVLDGPQRVPFFKKISLVSQSLSEVVYVFIWLLNAYNLRIILRESESNLLVAPDELYGFSLLVKFNSKPSNTWLINFNSENLFCNVVNFDSSFCYRYSCRSTFEPIDLTSEQEVLKMSNSYMESIFSSSVEHRDYSRTYSTGKELYVADKTLFRKRILIAAHIFSDAASSHQSSFNGFYNWLYEVIAAVEALSEPVDIYVKEHPSVSDYNEEGILKAFVSKFATKNSVELIDSSNYVDLRDFDLILTCNGSICFEAAYVGVPVISCSLGYTAELDNVRLALTSERLREYLFQFFYAPDRFESTVERAVTASKIANWVVLHDLTNLKVCGQDTFNDEVVKKVSRALVQYWDVRNQPGVTLLSKDLSEVNFVKCFKS